jgi:hypothetical protein
MSNKNEPANNLLTDAGPIRPDGPPDGSLDVAPQPERSSKPEPGKVSPTAASAPEQYASAVHAHLAGVADSLPPQWCPNCKVEVTPRGKGLCPRCSRFLRHSFVARKHPVNKLRCQQILEKLVADYQPRTTMLHATCVHLSGILEQLETMKPGTPEHQRLVQLSQLLAARLEESRPPRTETDDTGDLTVDQLVEKTTGMLRQLLEMRDAENAVKVPGVAGVDHIGSTVADRLEHVEGAPGLAGLTPEPTAAPAPEPCPYCNRAPCIGKDHHAYEVLHWNDPEEIKRRDAEATAVMMKMVRYGNPY